jgi:hypothetical protein
LKIFSRQSKVKAAVTVLFDDRIIHEIALNLRVGWQQPWSLSGDTFFVSVVAENPIGQIPLSKQISSTVTRQSLLK